MTKSVPSYLLVLLFLLTSRNDVDAHPRSDSAEDWDGLEREFADLWPFGQLAEGNDLAPRREEVLQKMQEILGIRSQNDNLTHRKVPPQFMMELYNTIADPSGVTRGRNPYNARVVRSFVEGDNPLSQFYFFNISGLEINESVLEAELHLYRKKTPLQNVRPLTITSAYYLIKVYQILSGRSVDVPSLHRLLNVRYVGVHAFGWQVFNVKEAVLGWVSGEPNLGLLVIASNLFEDEVSVEFSRRNDHHSKQPILVLFDDDSGDRSPAADVAPQYYAYEKQDDEEDELAYEKKSAKSERIDLEDDYGRAEHYRRHKRQRDGGQSEEVLLTDRREPEFFQRQKRRRDEDAASHDDSQEKRRRRHRDAASSRKRAGRIVSEDRARFPRVLTSMDIYERATLREKLGQTATRDRSRLSNDGARQRRLARSANDRNATEQENATRECTRHELYVDFRDIGLSSSIIAPVGYFAYQCKGVCEPPLSQDQRPTNHATIQATVHKMGLVKGVERPCCVPTKLLGTSILFYDDNENVVLKMYEDMIADRCGCR